MIPDIILQRTGIDVRAVEQGDDAWHTARRHHRFRSSQRDSKAPLRKEVA